MKLSSQITLLVTVIILTITVTDITRRLLFTIAENTRDMHASMYADDYDYDGTITDCPNGFNQFGEYCFTWDDSKGRNQSSSAAYCAEKISTLPYPTTDINDWQMAIFNISLNSGPWSGAKQQNDSLWYWPDGTEVQSDAWGAGQPDDGVVYCSYVASDNGHLNEWPCEETLTTLCQACVMDELTMDVSVVQDKQILEIVPMCVNGSNYSITVDDDEVNTSPGFTHIVENVSHGSHEVCITTYGGDDQMLDKLCISIFICPSLFTQYGDYCLHWEDNELNQSSSAELCAKLSSTLPYPTGKLDKWQTAVTDASRGSGPWSGATLQRDGGWSWPDGTDVQQAALGSNETYSGGYCLAIVNISGLLSDTLCGNTLPVLCQACDSDVISLDVSVDSDTQGLEIVPMCVTGDYYITLDDKRLEFSSGITHIENVTPGGHEVCIQSTNALCFQVYVCPKDFIQYGDYCFLWNDGWSNQAESLSYCIALSATLPYPTSDLQYWQEKVADATNGLDVWSNATLQSNGEWIWSDGTPVQDDAWESGEPSGNGSCSSVDGDNGQLHDGSCNDVWPTLCQVVPAPHAPLATLISTTSSSLHVQWTSDSDVISKYVVTWTSPTGEKDKQQTNYTDTELAITGLLCNTNYKVVVRAYTDVNNFASSPVVKATTNDIVPGKPSLKQIVPDESAPTKLEVSWYDANYSCSGGLSNYRITWQTNNYTWSHNSEDGSTTNYTIRHLLPNTKYIVSLVAVSFTGILGDKDYQTVTTTFIEKEKRCPQTTPFPKKYPLYKWAETDCKFVHKTCPSMLLGSASWVCGCDGNWVDLPDLSDCHSLDLSGWNDIFNTSDDSAGDSLGKLASNITSDEISTGDIQDLVEILDASSTRHSADMNNASLQDQFTLSFGYLSGILNISDIILDSVEVWHGFPDAQLKDQATNLQQIIANASVSMANVIALDDYIEFENFNQIGVKVQKQSSNIQYRNEINDKYTHQFFNGTWIILPLHLEQDPSIDTVAVSVISYQNLHCILNTVPQCNIIPDETMYPVQVVSSPIMGVTVNGEKWNSPDNESQIIFAFDNTYIQNGYTGANITCVFWNNIKENWDTKGCELLPTNAAEQPMCSCDHLTNLAVIMDVTGKLSITLILGLDATANVAACAIVAFVLHFFFLASFCWMGLEAVNIYNFFILKNETVLTRIRYQHVAAYGVPGLVVIVTLISTGGVGYGTEHYCWLDTDNGVIWALVAPASLILLFNTMIIIWALMIITAEAEQDGITRGHNITKVRVCLSKVERMDAKANVRRLLMLTVMLGPIWLLGFLSSYFGSIFLMGLFTIINSLQGAMIFALLVLVQKTRRDILFNNVLHINKLIECFTCGKADPKQRAIRSEKSDNLISLDTVDSKKKQSETLDTTLSAVPTTRAQYRGEMMIEGRNFKVHS